MVSGLKKLADFKGQEHITSVLRASVIKESPIRKISICGDDSLSIQILNAYVEALRCLQPNKGNACSACSVCTNPFPLDSWVLSDAEPAAHDKTVYYSFKYVPEFSHFAIRQNAGRALNKDVICLLIFGLCGEQADVLRVSETLGKYCVLDEFVAQALEVLRSLLYLKHNLEIVEVEHLDMLRKAAPGFHQYKITAAIRLLWDAKSHSAVADELAIQSLALSVAEILYPSPAPSYTYFMSDESSKPITIVEDTTGQILNIEEMLRIAQE